MKTILSSRRGHYLAKFSVFLIIVALIAGMVGCKTTATEYKLTISSTEGGNVTRPGEGNFKYYEGIMVTLRAAAQEGYQFVNWTGDVDDIDNVEDATTTITVNGNYSITANFAPLENLEIRTWDDLDAVRDNLARNYLLMNDLDSTTPGYNETASSAANQEKGWKPIGDWNHRFKGSFDGQGYDIKDLFINRPDKHYVGLFGYIGEGGVIQNVTVVNATVTGDDDVGGLVGKNWGTVSNSHSTGSVSGENYVGGLVGYNKKGSVSKSYSTGNVSGEDEVGGLVGWNDGTVSNSNSTGNVSGTEHVGGLVGINEGGSVSNSFSTVSVTGSGDVADHVGGLVGRNKGVVSSSNSTGTVTGNDNVGGLVGWNDSGTVSKSHSTGSVSGENYVGGLVGCNYEESTVEYSYSTGNVTGEDGVGGLVGSIEYSTVRNSHYNYDEVLINGENMITIGALFGEDFDQWLANGKFLDVNERLSQENGYYVVNNVTDFKELLAFGQNKLKFRLENDLDLATEPDFYIPYFAGEFDGNRHKISNLSLNFDFVYNVGLFGYLAPGGKVTQVGVENVNITGASFVGGLVGANWEGTVSKSHSTGNVTSEEGSFIGGLVGCNYEESTVSNSSSTTSVTGNSSVGGLVGWNHGALSTVSNSYSTGSVTGDDRVGGLVGQNGGTVIQSHSTGSVTGHHEDVGGLVGQNYYGEVSKSYSIGSVSGDKHVGGLVGYNKKGSVSRKSTVSNSYSTGSVTGFSQVGGLVGQNDDTVNSSYSTGSVSGKKDFGGLVGKNDGSVTRSFWDMETSGQPNSDGGEPKTTAEMKSIATFSEWDITGVGNLGERDHDYIWNIVDDEKTYPFLSWQPV